MLLMLKQLPIPSITVQIKEKIRVDSVELFTLKFAVYVLLVSLIHVKKELLLSLISRVQVMLSMWCYI